MSRQEKPRRAFRWIHESAEDVPIGLSCPRCNQMHQIIVSRLGERQNAMRRAMFFYFRCAVCDHRFRHPKFGTIATLVFCGGVLALFPLAITVAVAVF